MKQALFAMMLLPFLANADAVYDTFLDLKGECKAEWDGFYHSLSNNMSDRRGVWSENGSGLIFTATNICSAITNVEYYVDIVNVSTNIVSTNLTSVDRYYLTDGVHHFTYLAGGKISRIEHWLTRNGDFKCYEVDTNEDLTCYYSMTNFYGEHGLMMYKNGRLTEVGGTPDFSVLRKKP